MKILKNFLISLIKFYKLFISPYLGNRCRYLPTCSEYFIECLEEFGFLKGLAKGTKEYFLAIQLNF